MRIALAVFSLFLVSSAYAKECKLSLAGNDQMQYTVKELTVAADCTEVAVTLKHSGKFAKNVMGHNWVLSKTADVSALATAGMSAGPEKDYVPADDKRILAHTKLLGPGESDTVKFSKSILTAGGDYTFFCTFPGHFGVMKGKFVVK